MSERAERASGDGAAEPAATDSGFLRGAVAESASAVGATPGRSALRLGGVPTRANGLAAAAGVSLAVPVALTTWVTPGVGAVGTALAGTAAFAATVLTFQLGWTVGAGPEW